MCSRSSYSSLAFGCLILLSLQDRSSVSRLTVLEPQLKGSLRWKQPVSSLTAKVTSAIEFIPSSSGALDEIEKVQMMRLKAPRHHTSRAPSISLLTTRRVPTTDYWAVRSGPRGRVPLRSFIKRSGPQSSPSNPVQRRPMVIAIGWVRGAKLMPRR